MLVRFDGYADGSEDKEGWVEEATRGASGAGRVHDASVTCPRRVPQAGEDEWCWEEEYDEAADSAKLAQVETDTAEVNCYYCVARGGWRMWKAARELRPNWAWRGVETGWEVSESLEMPGERPEAEAEAEVAEAEAAEAEAAVKAHVVAAAEASAVAEVAEKAAAAEAWSKGAADEALARRLEAVYAWDDATSLVKVRGFEACPICMERDGNCVLLRACGCAVHEGCLSKAVAAAHAQRRYIPACVSIGCLAPLHALDAAALLGAAAWERTQRLMIGDIAHIMVRALRSPPPRLPSPHLRPRPLATPGATGSAGTG